MQPRPRRDRRSPRRSGSASCPSHLPLRRGRSGNKGLMGNEGSGVCWGAMLCRWLPTKGSRSALSPSAPSPGAGILTNAPSCTREMWVESSSAETCSEGGGGFASGPPPRGHRRAAEQLCCERGSVGEGVRVHGSPRAAPPYSHPRCFLRGAGTDPAPRGSDPRPETSGPTLVQTFYFSSRVRPALCSRCGARFVSCTHLRVWEGGNCWRGRCTPGTL